MGIWTDREDNISSPMLLQVPSPNKFFWEATLLAVRSLEYVTHLLNKANVDLIWRFPMQICDLVLIRTHQSKKALDFLPVLQFSAQQ